MKPINDLQNLTRRKMLVSFAAGALSVPSTAVFGKLLSERGIDKISDQSKLANRNGIAPKPFVLTI